MSLKQLKEQFVTGLHGGSILEIYAVTGISLAGFLAHTLLQRWAQPTLLVLLVPVVNFQIEFFLDVLLQLQSITVYSSRPELLYKYTAAAIIVSFLVRCFNKRSTQTAKTPTELLPKISYITAYRAQMIVITNLAILAVDFHVFPRRFAKVETWGTSLMDLGVGLFVYSMGLANSRSIIKKAVGPKTRAQGYFALIGQNTVKALPVLALGVIRLVSVKSLEYQEHVTEYGVHWNFFMTLGLLPIFLGVIEPLFVVLPRFFVALLIAVLYEAALTQGQLSAFILDESNRTRNLLTMNKEGAFSFIGYSSLFIFGQSFGLFVLTSRKTPNNLIGVNFCKKPVKWLTVTSTQGLLIVTCISFALFHGAKESLLTGSISRRLTNLPYILWVVSYNSLMLLGYNLVEVFCGPLYSAIFEAVNKNGLAIFLVANLTTGLVNMSINTLEMSDNYAYFTLAAYALSWVAMARVLDAYKIYIKL